jgi:hypothetical protein
MIKKNMTLVACLALLGTVSTALAAISVEEVARLGKDLTPVGAEKAGNAEGTIPAWEGGLTKPFANWPNQNNDRPNPYAADQVLYTITAQNMDQHADKLPEAAKAMLKAYPDVFKMKVYPSRRTAAYPQWYYDNIARNATTAKLIKDGDGVEGVWASIPFPIPKNGHEVLWNHILRFQGIYRTAKLSENIIYSNGKRLDFNLDVFIHQPFYDLSLGDKLRKEGTIFKYLSTITSPARDSGEGVLAHDNIDMASSPRKAWQYDPGERRVRRAPNLAFDTPDRALNVVDDYELFSGSPERYDFKLVGKKEMYIPYNNNEVNAPHEAMEEVTPVGYIQSDLLRYELHRVWVVEATLKEGKRHLYAKRVFYVDEDTWNIMATEKYDGNGNLWRVGFYYPTVAPEVPLTGAGSYTHVDLKTNGYYVALGSHGKGRVAWDFQQSPPDAKFYTPASLRRRGR